jgi:hypothetical protein
MRAPLTRQLRHCVQAPEKRSVPSASGAIVGHWDGTIHGSAAASPFQPAQEFVEREGTRGPHPQPATAQSWVVFNERDVLLFNMRGCGPFYIASLRMVCGAGLGGQGAVDGCRVVNLSRTTQSSSATSF